MCEAAYSSTVCHQTSLTVNFIDFSIQNMDPAQLLLILFLAVRPLFQFENVGISKPTESKLITVPILFSRGQQMKIVTMFILFTATNKN